MEQAITLTTGDLLKGILALAGGIVTITAAVSALGKLFSPYKAIRDNVERHKKLLENDHSRISALADADVHMCRSLLALMDHALTGNSVDRLRTAKDDLQRYLTERK